MGRSRLARAARRRKKKVTGVGDPDSLIDRGLRRSQPALDRIAQAIVDHVDQAPDLELAHASLFSTLTTNVGELIASVAVEPFIADLMGRLEVDNVEMGRALADFSNVQPEEAIKFFRSKKIMSDSAFNKLQAQYKQDAFAVAGLSNHYDVNQVHQALARAIETGEPQQSVVKELQELVPGMTKSHAELVFRNNVVGSYQRGRYAQLQRVARRRPFWEYQAVADDRTRTDHLAMNGKVFAVDSPVWRQWYPPNGHQCRCSVVSLSREDVRREGVTPDTEAPTIEEQGKEPRKAEPDKGWAVSPAVTGDKASKTFTAAASKFKTLRPPKLAKSGAKALLTSGDLGGVELARKIRTVDRLAGLNKTKAAELVSHGRVNVGTLRRLPARSIEARVPVASQYVDSGDQLVRRLASEPETASMIESLRVTAQSSYIPAELGIARAELAIGEGISRGTENVISVVARNRADFKSLAASVLQAEAGHGSPIRRAVESADIILRGNVSPVEGFVEATLNHRNLSGRREMRLTKKPLKGFTSERVLVTIARAKDLD
jgi:SPP1 gp7 family putative phage head morphogenesis protein